MGNNDSVILSRGYAVVLLLNLYDSIIRCNERRTYSDFYPPIKYVKYGRVMPIHRNLV